MANRYWFGATGAWTTTATTVWAAATPISFTASCSGTALTTTGSPALVVGMTVRNAAGTTLGTISSGSGNSWVVSTGGTHASQTMYATTVGASVPTAADSVFFNTPYAQTVTLTGALLCLDFTVSAGPVTFTSTGTVTSSGSMSLVTGTVWSATGTITFNATTAKTITTAGITINSSMTLNGIGGSWQLQDALNMPSGRTFTLTNGTLDLNNKTLTAGLFSSTNSNARTIAFGASGVITVIATGTIWNTAIATNLTVTGTPTVNVSNNSATTATIAAGVVSEANSISFNITVGTYTLSFLATANHAARNVNFTGFAGTWGANSTGIIYGNLTLSTGMTITGSSANAITFGATSGTKTITTNGKGITFPLTFNGAGGAWQLQDNLSVTNVNVTVTLTAGTLNLNDKILSCAFFASSNANTRNISFGTIGNITVNASGGTVWNTTTTTGLTVTGTPLVKITNSSTFATTITPGSPSESNTISFIINSVAAFALTITAGNIRSLDLANYVGQLQNTAISVYGDYTLGPSMSFSATITSATTFASTSGTSRTIRNNGKTIPFPLIFNGIGGSWILADSMYNTNASTGITWSNGSIDLNNFSLGLNELTVTATGTFTFGTGAVNLDTSLGPATLNIGSGLTFPTVGSTFNCSPGGGQSASISMNFSGSNQPKLNINFSGGSVSLSSFAADLNIFGISGTISFPGTATLYNTLIPDSVTVVPPTTTILSSGKNSDTTVSIQQNWNSTCSVISPTPGYKISLINDLTLSSFIRYIGMAGGTLDLNGFNLTAGAVYSTSNSSFTMNNGNITITRDDVGFGGPVWQDQPGVSSIAFNDSSGSINFTSTTASSSMATYTSTTIPKINVSGSPAFTIYNSVNSSLNMTDISSTGADIILLAGQTFNFSAFTLSGCALKSSSTAQQATVSKTSGTVSVSNLTISWINATGGAIWNAFTSNGNVDGGNNSGWIFVAATKLYLGVKSRIQAYLGIRTDGQLYRGTKTIGWI